MPVGIRQLFSVGLVSLCVFVGGLVFASAPALAAPEAPKIEEQSVTDVASSSATLDAQVNPGGTPTTYKFEYAPAGGAFTPVSEPEGSGSLPEGASGVSLSVHVQEGLAPGASYKFRTVASNSVETVIGEPVSFTTQHSGGEFALPDGRQYEMVTPPQKEGALFSGLGPVFVQESFIVVQASVAGDAIADIASQPTEAEPQGYGGKDVSVLSTRSATGWSSQVIMPPHDQGAGPGDEAGEYRLFSEDLSRGIIQPFGQFSPFSPEASEQTPYLHADYLNGNVNEHCQTLCFQPLVTAGNTPPGTKFGEAPDGVCFPVVCGPRFVGASPDLSHVVVSSPVQLTATHADTNTLVGEGGLYEWSGGHLQPVSIFPSSNGVASATLAGAEALPRSTQGARRAISEDGDRVIFVSGGGTSPTGLYLRDLAKGETIRLDVPEAGATGTSEHLQYMTASSDASRVFFLDDGRLTEDSGAISSIEESGDEPDLYECEIAEVEGKLKCDLHDLTPPLVAGGEAADVVTVLGASDDGSYVYFAAGGALTPNTVAAPGNCRFAGGSTEGCNVYASHDGVTRLVAPGWTNDAEAPRESRVSPDGRWLAFMSPKSLTGYDMRDAVSGHPDDEVYLYDAAADGGEGKLVCVSCNPTGARPVGADSNGAWAAASVPQWTFFAPQGFGETRYQSRYLSNSGRLFFEGDDTLVPQDVNGVGDVYEFEPTGVGSCSEATASGSSVYVGVSGGCVGLISSGTSSEESSFLDASETGGDVFFLTTSRLAPQDFDDAYDVYDAHECTVLSPCPPASVTMPSACVTEAACRPSPTPQPSIYGLPASATFSGSGNVTPLSVLPVPKRTTKKTASCRRGFTKRHGQCLKSRRRKSRARKSSNNRGAR